MNKWISLAACAALALSMAACDGDDGAPGVTGATGATGISGATGSDGANGQDGADGVNGEDLTISIGTRASKVQFSEIEVPLGDAQNRISASNMVTVGDSVQELSFTKLFTTEDSDNGETYGLMKDYQDAPITLGDGTPYICNGTSTGVGSGLDFVSVLQKNNKLYMVSQFECGVGAIYKNELEQDTQTGKLSVKADTLEFISQKAEFGGFVHCAGQTTPWQSHLGSEEYEPDARAFETYVADNTQVPGDYGNYNLLNGTLNYWGGDLTKVSPYYYGWTPEVQIKADGTTDYFKHYTLGRFAHELAYVMPDRKTVYLSDDGGNVGLFMFVADEVEDLSAGTLYAAKWNQTSDANGGRADISWVKLGHSDNATIRAFLDSDGDVNTASDAIKFSDIFESADATAEGECGVGFTSINTSAGHECLQLKAGKETEAAFLETRRYAAMLGATTEFNKEEGITFSADHDKLFVAMSSVDKGMQDDASQDIGGPNHIRLDKNACGAVYAMDVAPKGQVDQDGTEIESAYIVNNMYSIINGTPKTYEEGSAYFGNRCDVNGISNPDNVTYLPGSNILSIGEDTSMHLNNMIWALDITNGSFTRTFATPLRAETTSPFWYENINGWSYMTAVTQHPGVATEELGQSSVGVLGAIKHVESIAPRKLIKVGSYNTHTEAASEISAYDASEKKLFITNGAANALDVIDMSNVNAPEKIHSIDLSTYGAGVQSVAVKNGKVAAAVAGADKVIDKGKVLVFNTSDYTLLSQTQVGYLPDMIAFNADGSKIVVANEAEPLAATTGTYSTGGDITVTASGGGDYVDVPGSVGLITVASATTTDDATGYAEVDFSAATLTVATDTTPVRLGGTPSNDKALDIEPEYVVIDGNFAYVTLQENNAIAKVDISGATPAISLVKSLGAKDYETQNTIDIEEDGIIKMKNYKGLKALYMPDTIATYAFGGATYLVTANEGDGREYIDSADNDVHIDEIKIKNIDFTGDPLDGIYDNDNDLKVLTDMGVEAGDTGELYTFGGRSFSIWDNNGDLVFDSGDQLSKLVATHEPKLFNHDDFEMDGRSGNKGVEPEALTVGTIDGKTYVFLGLERQSAIVMFDITSPYDVKYVDYIPTHTQNDISPEGMLFIKASESPNGKNLLVVSYEMSGSTVVYEVK
jgi:secreted PhoX family phosphatase